ncbi:MAG: sensor histidine kinase, partial [Lachnospiraceae bacterium]|nr:sensor histidine kinase [Lachnospiraceae bacterium]
FESLQDYINNDARARHDFRQTIYTLNSLSARGDYDSIKEYLGRYIETLPSKETTDYFSNNALNALLNHYAIQAANNDIKADIKVSLPIDLHVDIVDLCSVIGNIFENAITACKDIPKEDRFIKLVVSEEQGNEIYIAISNSFSGKVRQKKDRYLSTHKGGNGIGLVSISATASAYGGTAGFSHDEKTFYSNVMLKNRSKE